MAALKIQDAPNGDAGTAAARAAALIPTAYPNGSGGWDSKSLSVAGLVSALKATTSPASINSGATGAAGASTLYAAADHTHALDVNGFTQLTAASDVDQNSFVLVTAKSTATSPAVPFQTFKQGVDKFLTARTLTGCVLSGGDLQQTKLSGVKEQWRADITSGASFGMSGVTAGNAQKLLLTQDFTLTLPNVDSLITAGSGYSLTILAVQDAAGGRTLTIVPPAGQTIDWGEAGATQPRTAANAKTLYRFYYIHGSGQWFGGEAWR